MKAAMTGRAGLPLPAPDPRKIGNRKMPPGLSIPDTTTSSVPSSSTSIIVGEPGVVVPNEPTTTQKPSPTTQPGSPPSTACKEPETWPEEYDDFCQNR